MQLHQREELHDEQASPKSHGLGFKKDLIRFLINSIKIKCQWRCRELPFLLLIYNIMAFFLKRERERLGY